MGHHFRNGRAASECCDSSGSRVPARRASPRRHHRAHTPQRSPAPRLWRGGRSCWSGPHRGRPPLAWHHGAPPPGVSRINDQDQTLVDSRKDGVREQKIQGNVSLVARHLNRSSWVWPRKRVTSISRSLNPLVLFGWFNLGMVGTRRSRRVPTTWTAPWIRRGHHYGSSMINTYGIPYGWGMGIHNFQQSGGKQKGILIHQIQGGVGRSHGSCGTMIWKHLTGRTKERQDKKNKKCLNKDIVAYS